MRPFRHAKLVSHRPIPSEHLLASRGIICAFQSMAGLQTPSEHVLASRGVQPWTSPFGATAQAPSWASNVLASVHFRSHLLSLRRHCLGVSCLEGRALSWPKPKGLTPRLPRIQSPRVQSPWAQSPWVQSPVWTPLSSQASSRPDSEPTKAKTAAPFWCRLKSPWQQGHGAQAFLTVFLSG